ncbi:LSM domain-containing protein [Aureococcus anophagefferens]|nr:LSM domain-containing protein [Aureococcus anophagefferens]
MHSAESISGGPSGLLGRRAQRMHKGRHIFCRAASMARISGRERASLVRRVGAAVERHAPKIMKMSMLVGAMACLAGTRSSSCMPRPVDLDETLEPTFTDGARKYWHLRFTCPCSEDGDRPEIPPKLSDGDDVEKEKEAALERLWAGLIDEHGEHLGLGSSAATARWTGRRPRRRGKLLRLDLKEIKALRAMGRAIKGYFSLAALPNGGTRRKYAQQKVDAVMEAVTPADGAAKNLLRGISRVCCGDNVSHSVIGRFSNAADRRKLQDDAGKLARHRMRALRSDLVDLACAREYWHQNDDVRLDTFAGGAPRRCIGEPHQRECADEIKTSMRERLLALNRLRLSVKERQATNHTNLDVFVVASDPRLVDVTVKHADGSSSFVKKRITDNHAWKFYAGASGKGKDNDYFFHHAALTHLVDFYVAKRVKDNKPPLTRIDAKTSKSRRSTLSLDKYFYRFITWTQDDPIGVDDDDVFFADKSAKWSASPVEGCKSDREYRSGADRGPEMRQSDGWTRTIILKPPSGDDRSSVIAQGLAEKDARLAALAPKIRKGDVVALGISQSERDAQGVDFYLAKVVVPPARGQPASGQRLGATAGTSRRASSA